MPLDRALRQMQDFRDFGLRQPHEETQLHDFSLFWRSALQFFKCFVECNDNFIIRRSADFDFIERNLFHIFSVPNAQPAPRAIDEDVTHRLRRRAEEVTPALPAFLFVPN